MVFGGCRSDVAFGLQIAGEFAGVTQTLDDRVHEACVADVAQAAESCLGYKFWITLRILQKI